VQQGVVKKWLSEKGYGFLRPDDGSQDVFVHISAFADRTVAPAAGDLVEFDISSDPADPWRLRATNARLL
jgi:cold shock CspA family protein